MVRCPPPNTALLVDKNSARRGRRAQGRMFLYGCLLEDDVSDSGSVADLTRVAVQDAITEFLDTTTTVLGCPAVILQNTTPTGPGAPDNPTPPISPPPVIQSLDVSPLAATQRRRLRR